MFTNCWRLPLVTMEVEASIGGVDLIGDDLVDWKPKNRRLQSPDFRALFLQTSKDHLANRLLSGDAQLRPNQGSSLQSWFHNNSSKTHPKSFREGKAPQAEVVEAYALAAKQRQAAQAAGAAASPVAATAQPLAESEPVAPAAEKANEMEVEDADEEQILEAKPVDLSAALPSSSKAQARRTRLKQRQRVSLGKQERIPRRGLGQPPGFLARGQVVLRQREALGSLAADLVAERAVLPQPLPQKALQRQMTWLRRFRSGWNCHV